MPRTLVRAHRDEDRDQSLGWLCVAWVEHFVRHGPGNVQGMPVQHGDEFTGFIVDAYALDDNGRMRYDSAFFSRPKARPGHPVTGCPGRALQRQRQVRPRRADRAVRGVRARQVRRVGPRR